MFEQSCKDFGIQKVSFGTRPRHLLKTYARSETSEKLLRGVCVPDKCDDGTWGASVITDEPPLVSET